jgi:Protein of unknown function (DUF3592)
MGDEPLNLPGIPGSEPEPVRRPAQMWIELIFAVVFAVAVALAGLGFVVLSVSGHEHTGTRVGQAISAAIAIALLYVCTRLAIRSEHRLRRGVTAAQEAASQAMRDAQRQRLARRRHRDSPVALTVLGLIWTGLAIVLAVGAVVNVSNWSRSRYTQNHGVRVSGTVISANNSQVCSARGGCSYTATITVQLSHEIGGLSVTTAHYPASTDLVSGEPVTVLVDPKQPSYAELPGHAYTTAIQWILGFVLAAFLGLLAYFDWRSLTRALARRRAARGNSSQPAATTPA